MSSNYNIYKFRRNNREAQEDELTVLESIYDKNVLHIDRSSEFPSGRFFAHPIVPEAYRVRFIEKGENDCKEVASLEVKYLPPITLLFNFHGSYPSCKHPAFLISSEWLTLSQLELLCQHLEKLWIDGKNEVILYTWMQYLQDVLSHLKLQNGLTVNCSSEFRSKHLSSMHRSFQYCEDKTKSTNLQNRYNRQLSGSAAHRKASEKHDQQAQSSSCHSQNFYHRRTTDSTNFDESSKLLVKTTNFYPCIHRGTYRYDRRALCLMFPRRDCLISLLKGYNERKIKEDYENEWFTCDVCMEEKQGKFFMRFSDCQHMYCKDCMKSYFEVQINDGTVSSITCPKEKCSTAAIPSQIQELVGPELYARYDKLLLTAILDTMTDVMYCPRLFCQCPVMLEPDRSMARCPSCQFVFCIYCKMVYHGVASCKFKREERRQIHDEYLASSKKDKELMEQRYGRQTLRMLIDETRSEEWLESNSKRCPDCGSAIEKFEGCNKITCWRCGSYFCWLCMSKLKTANPYSHFNDADSPCFNQLFQGVDFEEDEDWEVGAFL